MDKQEFIEQIAYYVMKYAKSYGILVHSPIIAQAILESGWGKSRLASSYFNFFGLKCGTRWKGKSVNLTTQEEYTEGTLTTIKDNFRVFDSMEDGVKGYFDFIQLPRYENLKGITDPRAYLETIKGDGYATSSTYVHNNMKLVEQYNLTQYDERNDESMRNNIINIARNWIGLSRSAGTHHVIIDTYNAHRPLARGYAVTYRDEYCATFVSACAIKAGCTDIIPCECGCEEMIKLFKKIGSWCENDSHVPTKGDVIFYDWDDLGRGDCTGHSDHVGIVESCNGSTITVIEGNMNSGVVGRRNIGVNARYIRGFGLPKYPAEKPLQNVPVKPLDTVVLEVINGMWGNGQEREENLRKAGYDPSQVQAMVNQKLSRPAQKSVDEVAKEVINGKWGNGEDRKRRLKDAGYDPDIVQAKVNEILHPKQSVDDVAREVIQGKWGNGQDRRNRLQKAGFNPDVVQKRVNELLR